MPALTCVRHSDDCDFMLAHIMTAMSCVIHIPCHVATSHHHYTISDWCPGNNRQSLAAKVKWALYKHRSMLHICLRSYITAVVQLYCCNTAMVQLCLCKPFDSGNLAYALASLSSGLSSVPAASAHSELLAAPGLMNLSVQAWTSWQRHDCMSRFCRLK